MGREDLRRRDNVSPHNARRNGVGIAISGGAAVVLIGEPSEIGVLLSTRETVH